MKNRTTRLNHRQAITYELLEEGYPLRIYGSKCAIQKLAKYYNRQEERTYGKRFSKYTAKAYR